MPITTIGIGAAVTPTVIKTYVSHYTNRKPRRQKPTAHISYDEGLNLIRTFLDYASHHTVEDFQAFTAQWVPNPSWVRTENVPIPTEYVTKAASAVIAQLGDDGINQVGGRTWWQWRRKDVDLKAEWIEMRADYNARKQLGVQSKRIMLYVHGGAYFFGSVDEHRYQMQRHARKLKARVFAPRYRLSPQFPFPCGLQDCMAAYLYLLTMYDRTEIILAGDSAGGGMVVSLLCMMRDQGIPLPAGAILISPWVDLTHSFPSVAGGNEFDYIPAHGFMQKPSTSWPPPNDDDMEIIRQGAAKGLVSHKLEKRSVQQERSQGFTEHKINTTHEADTQPRTDAESHQSDRRVQREAVVPGPNRHLSIKIDGKMIELRDQIQMYTTNQLISHPLVSPVLQPSLGGLPPLLILTGGGEVLRDEQIYLAHKAANPAKYPLGDVYRARYDPDDTILNKYKPTPVQLQVWEDLCHVAPTLSFTRPAKFMYRSIAQFGAWALARAQNTSIELMDDDDISIISSSGSDSDSDRPRSSIEGEKKALAKSEDMAGAVGKAGDPIPPFKNHMIRQRVDRHGNIYPLKPTSTFAALHLAPEDVGVIKEGPVRKWMDAKRHWDTQYARSKRRIQQKRIKDFVKKGQMGFGQGETPPPSALAGRQHEEHEMMTQKLKKSFGLAMWSGWGSKHDEVTIKREEEAEQAEPVQSVSGQDEYGNTIADEKLKKKRSMSRSRAASGSKKPINDDRSRSRRRTVSVKDAGQVEGSVPQDQQQNFVPVPVPFVTPVPGVAAATTTDRSPAHNATTSSSDDSHLSPVFLPKYKTDTHLRGESRDVSDSSSVRAGAGAFGNTIPDDASTTAVFAAPGVSRHESGDNITSRTIPTIKQPAEADGVRPVTPDAASTIGYRSRPTSALDGYDSPVSRRSVERLMSHQTDFNGTGQEGDTVSLASYANGTAGPGTSDITANDALLGATRIQPTRTTSSMAVFETEGVVGVVRGGEADHRVIDHASTEAGLDNTRTEGVKTTTPERPAMYDRSKTVFKTALETL